MGSVYQRGDSRLWWLAYKDATGKRCLVSSGTADENVARAALAALERRVRAERESGLAVDGPLTVARYAERWIEERRRRGVASAGDDAARLAHALKRIGHMTLTDVRPRHVKEVVRHLEAAGEHAPRTIRHVYGVLRVMFSDALTEELLVATPCVLRERRSELPRKMDADPAWRPGAVFARDEVEALISDERLDERRRVLWSLLFMSGVRINEVTPRTWRDYDTKAEPLGMLTVATSYSRKHKRVKPGTKTGVARQVPVHPTLATVLASWRLSGWARTFGRQPRPEDLLLPRDNGEQLCCVRSLVELHQDLKTLGLRERRQHDARRTFVTLTQAGGANRDIVKWITHGPPGDIVGSYTSLPWATLCEAVSYLKIQRLEGRVLALASNETATAVLRSSQGVESMSESECTRRDSKPDGSCPGVSRGDVSGGFDGGEGSEGVASSPSDTGDRSNRSSDYERRGVLLGFKVKP